MRSSRAWTPEEFAWAHECAAAGDTFAEIGGALDCPDLEEVQARLGVRRRLQPAEKEVAELFAAGLTTAEIDRARGHDPRNSNASHALRRIETLGYQLRVHPREDFRAELRRLLPTLSTGEVARRLGLPQRTIQRNAVTLGLGRTRSEAHA